jgi:uncharacterized SAM-binding protein YcdF (DUF218 family)
MKSRICFYGSLIVIIILFIAGCRKAGQWLVKEDELLHANAMVILMGSISDRVLQAADLYNQKVADKVIIVEESMGAYRVLEEKGVHLLSNSRQVLNAIVILGISADSIIILPGDATSTKMEAMIIKEYVAENPNIDTLLIVTSSDHTRRASMIFKSAFRDAGKKVYISCSPSSYTNFDAKRWWKNKEDIQTVFMEYIKIVNFLLFER